MTALHTALRAACRAAAGLPAEPPERLLGGHPARLGSVPRCVPGSGPVRPGRVAGAGWSTRA